MKSTRLIVEYSDQNEAFARFLPRAGSVVSEFNDRSGNKGWYLLVLDDPFEYQVKIGEPFQFRGTNITHFLIRSRWLGVVVGAREPASVFILLVEEGSHPRHDPIDVGDYIHAAWGMVRLESAAGAVPEVSREVDEREPRWRSTKPTEAW